MKNLIRCKVCGFIMDEGSLKDVCPACGVPKTAFEPYSSKVSEKRENILNLHIHPILVHLPQGFIIFLFIILILKLIVPEPFDSLLLITANIICNAMPVFVALAIISGIFDGKVRFKKLKSPYIKIKIVSGSILFILSLILIILIILGHSNYIIMFIFSALFILCSSILGKIGVSLINVKVPG